MSLLNLVSRFGHVVHLLPYSAERHNVLVMEFLGQDLKKLFENQKRHFSLKTILMLAEQLITRIEYIHKKNYLHKDIKPDNILIGYGESKSTIYLADFGLSKNYNQFTVVC